MKTALSTLMTLILAAVLLAACIPATAAAPVTIREADAGKTIEIKTGETLMVSLDGNLTTGYTWEPAPQEPALLTPVGESEAMPASAALGAPGKIVLKFTAAATGQTLLHLDYKRPWEKDIPAEKTFEVTVVVK